MFTASASHPVLVIGSANVDVSVSTEVLPRPGETVIGHGSLLSLGGKGANQAVACVACGAPTLLLGRVGADAFGHMVQEGLRERGVGLDPLAVLADAGTGLATISVEASGRNCIIVVPGANARLTPADIEARSALVQSAAYEALLKRRRRELHAKVARTLTEQFAQLA